MLFWIFCINILFICSFSGKCYRIPLFPWTVWVSPGVQNSFTFNSFKAGIIEWYSYELKLSASKEGSCLRLSMCSYICTNFVLLAIVNSVLDTYMLCSFRLVVLCCRAGCLAISWILLLSGATLDQCLNIQTSTQCCSMLFNHHKYYIHVMYVICMPKVA